ncbi:MAG TPA: hypothetical protein VGC14_02530 [Rhizobium sp.]
MTLAEFKAWFEGFTETLEAAPNEKQWERIKARVAEINGAVTTYPVFVDRYVPPYRPWYVGTPLNPTFYSTNTSSDVKSTISLNGDHVGATYSEQSVFDMSSAMIDLGKAEFRSLAL